jgi:uncharacterized protein (DUF2236 family)
LIQSRVGRPSAILRRRDTYAHSVAFDLLDQPRARVAASVRHRIAGPDFAAAHQRIWHTPGARWFTEKDPIWQVHADVAMFVGGIRALLLQSLHPVAMAAVSGHSGFRGDPWGRLHRTSHFLATTTYGTIDDAERSIARVNGIHRRVRGRTPEGKAYRADDPDLLAWIHLAEVDSFLASHQAFGEDALDDADADAYVAQTGLVATKLGVLDPPRSVRQLADQLAGYRPLLRSTAPAREAADLLLHDPPIAGLERAGYTFLAAGAVSLLPMWARVELSLPSLPTTDRLVTRSVTRAALRTLRWALRG